MIFEERKYSVLPRGEITGCYMHQNLIAILWHLGMIRVR